LFTLYANISPTLQVLEYDGKPMLDILSLADFKGIDAGGSAAVTVKTA